MHREVLAGWLAWRLAALSITFKKPALWQPFKIENIHTPGAKTRERVFCQAAVQCLSSSFLYFTSPAPDSLNNNMSRGPLILITSRITVLAGWVCVC
jgi:hypothetical protein